MRPREDYEEVERFLRSGLNDCQVSRLSGIPRRTIRDWRVLGEPGNRGSITRGHRNADCPSCAGAMPDGPAYAYLLGLYLGDGCISEYKRGVFRLRITLDSRYPGIILECALAMSAVRPSGRMAVGLTEKVGCVEVGAHWRHWPCLFPQHGPGRKHERRIVLAAWQDDIVRAHSDRLLRGLIHSDGCRGLNRVNGKGYPRYLFSNNSDDIRGIFCRACEDFGVRWRQSKWNVISVARRPSVRKLDLVIGPKE